MENVYINELSKLALAKQSFEIVERKGIGHPDTICDSVMNEISVELSKTYMEEFGMILHHNLDKCLLAAGQSVPSFGGGKIVKPMTMVFGDRATYKVGKTEIPVADIAMDTADQWFSTNMRYVTEDSIVYDNKIQPGSMALQDIFDRQQNHGNAFMGANDTSAAVGYAPLTPTEVTVKELEAYLNSNRFKQCYPATGEDIKLMALRRGNDLDITVAVAMVDRWIHNERDYITAKRDIESEVYSFIRRGAKFNKVEVHLNSLDTPERGIHGLYLTVLGSSAEAGDSGQVGRGNNATGVIPLNRPMSSEAAAGKNPVSHVGKIYNALSYHIADRIHKKIHNMEEVYVWLLSRIGQPINQPSAVSVQYIAPKAIEMDLDRQIIEQDIQEVIEDEFAVLDKYCEDLANGRISIC